MNPKDLERLERFTAAALTGICTSESLMTHCTKQDVNEKKNLGISAAQLAVGLGALTLSQFMLMEKEIDNESKSTTTTT